jgi:hypothetical protein
MYNPGRYDGDIILIPKPTGFTVLGDPGSGHNIGNFYNSYPVDPTGHGTYDLLQYGNDCNPDCWQGTITSHLWKWNGTTYAP